MAEITRIEKTFTYDIADAYLYQTNALKRTAEWTYTGPDKMWTFIDETTKKLIGRFHYTERDNGADIPTPVGQIKVLVDANVNPCIASLFHNEYTYGDLPHTVENLPDGNTYGHPDPIPPDHTYEITEIVYNTETGEFVKPYPWKQPHVTWEELIRVRDVALALSDNKVRNAASDELKTAWEEYRQKLRDLPTLMAGVDPWKVIIPEEPDVNTEPLNPGE